MKLFTNYEEYNAKLNDARWRTYAKKIKDRDGNKCRCCGAEKNLQVHHRAYIFYKRREIFQDPWFYPENILITLCERCHKNGHSKFKVPIKYI
jgi:5-methylcytosine-specific restriction endonuclease McrA